MLCPEVVPLLSAYFDEQVDPDTALSISRHLERCHGCREEYRGIVRAHDRLKSLDGVQPPDYLRDLVHIRIADMQKNGFHAQIRDILELQWSRIKTTEAMWYATKAIGTALAAVIFFLIPCSINPINIQADSSLPERTTFSRVEKQQVALNVAAKLGMLSEQDKKELAKPARPQFKPSIHEQYVTSFGQSISESASDYDFSVVTYVDSTGKGRIQNVIEHPNAHGFLDSFNKVISTGRFAPARKNGEAVPSHIVLRFSKISVYD